MPITTYNLVSNLPTEIILEFAPYLERPSIFKAIRVCRRWSDILSPLVWKSISKTDWHIPYFPIQQSKDTIRYDDSLLVPFLEYTQTLEWHNNLSLVPTDSILACLPLKNRLKHPSPFCFHFLSDLKSSTLMDLGTLVKETVTIASSNLMISLLTTTSTTMTV
ncbi:hypothetical protein FBU30_000487 [Linnemannia zychae]|nr:hypothetical protein FBU30_000487 [Linnemannia zychae]